MSTLLGTSLGGRYRLDEQVGTGGMSTVYRAFDVVLERPVAVKLMHREFARDSDQLERFRREARAVAQLSHPHIVSVIDAGEEAEPSSRPFIVFEIVEGETLKQRIRRLGRLDIEEAIAYAIEIARALECAHARNIVHRDIKPQNVLIDGDGSAKVTDFGIARVLDDDGLTADGRVLGTTDYVSPEQALGHDVNGQSDLYSLGIVLYEMLVGDVPFHGETQVAVAMKHVREDLPDVQARRPEVSATLAAIVDRMTDKDLARRYPDAETAELELENAFAIEAARAGHPITGEATNVLRSLPESTRRRIPLRLRWHVPVALVLLAAIAAAVVAVLVFDQAKENTVRGTGPGRVKPEPNTRIVSVSNTSAKDYDPAGDDAEHSSRTPLAVDRDASTAWDTETYTAGDLQKAGVGLYLDAKPKTQSRFLVIDTPKPGWRAAIYVAPAGKPVPASIDGWKKVGGGEVSQRDQRFSLSTGEREYRYFLVWITKLAPGEKSVEISDVSILAPQVR